MSNSVNKECLGLFVSVDRRKNGNSVSIIAKFEFFSHIESRGINFYSIVLNKLYVC